MRKAVLYPRLGEILSRSVGSRSQQEVADWCGVSQASVSNWLSGFKRPQPLPLAHLASMLNLPPDTLAEAASYDPQEVARLCENLRLTDYSSLLDFAQDMAFTVHRARSAGNPRLAIDQAEAISRHVRRTLTSLSEPKYREPYLNLLARLLVERGRVCDESLPAGQAIAPMQGVVEELYAIADELQDEQSLGFAYTTLGAINYLLDRHETSCRYHLNALPLLSEPFWRADVARAAAVASGQSKHAREMRSIENRIEDIIQREQNIDSSTITYMLEGLGRGQSLLGLPKSLQTLKRAEEIHEKGLATKNEEPLRELQLIRSQTYALAQVQRSDLRLIEDLGKKAIVLAKAHGYQRYVNDLERFLRSVLDK